MNIDTIIPLFYLDSHVPPAHTLPDTSAVQARATPAWLLGGYLASQTCGTPIKSIRMGVKSTRLGNVARDLAHAPSSHGWSIRWYRELGLGEGRTSD